jgi:hypothetical protein
MSRYKRGSEAFCFMQSYWQRLLGREGGLGSGFIWPRSLWHYLFACMFKRIELCVGWGLAGNVSVHNGNFQLTLTGWSSTHRMELNSQDGAQLTGWSSTHRMELNSPWRCCQSCRGQAWGHRYWVLRRCWEPHRYWVLHSCLPGALLAV